MPVIVIVGYGPGNGHALAERFGREGWSVALVGRTASRLEDGVARLAASGASAHAFVADASDPTAVRDVVRRVREQLGPITSVALTAFRSVPVPDVLSAEPEVVAHVFDIGVTGLLATVQAALGDLRAVGTGSVLVVNGALGQHDDAVDAFSTTVGGDGVALECAAKTKLVGLLAARLRAEGVYVGEVVINGSVAGSPYAGPTAIDPADIADRLWAMAAERTEVHVHVAEQRA